MTCREWKEPFKGASPVDRSVQPKVSALINSSSQRADSCGRLAPQASPDSGCPAHFRANRHSSYWGLDLRPRIEEL